MLPFFGIDIIYLLFYFFSFFPFLNGQIINNPIKTDKVSNPIDYIINFKAENNQVIITEGGTLKTISMSNNINIVIHDSYLYSQPLFICVDESNNQYLFLDYKLFSFQTTEDQNVISNLILRNSLQPDIKFYGYIKGIESQGETPQKDAKCESLRNEIIIYGRRGQFIYFYFLSENKEKVFSVNFIGIEGEISCKLVKDNVYICACTEYNQITLKILAHVYTSENMEGLIMEKTIDVQNYNNHDNAIIYDTYAYNYKIVCARKISDNTIECKPFYINSIYSLDNSETTINFLELTSEYTANYSYYENNCNFTIFYAIEEI